MLEMSMEAQTEEDEAVEFMIGMSRKNISAISCQKGMPKLDIAT